MAKLNREEINKKIETILNENDFGFPISFVFFPSSKKFDKDYVTYREYSRSNPQMSANNFSYGVTYMYEFIIHSKTGSHSFFEIEQKLIQLLEKNGFEFLSSRTSADLYDFDLGYFYKCFYFRISELF